MHEELVNRLGGLSLPRKSVVRLTDSPNMTLDVYRGRKTTIQQVPDLIMKAVILKKTSKKLPKKSFLSAKASDSSYTGTEIRNFLLKNLVTILTLLLSF